MLYSLIVLVYSIPVFAGEEFQSYVIWVVMYGLVHWMCNSADIRVRDPSLGGAGAKLPIELQVCYLFAVKLSLHFQTLTHTFLHLMVLLNIPLMN